jgi:nitroimidazol reductase NimA-like FMN-containing flavoprotein (pyridoxamine 5'-phosphate oxidase superfamily)
MDVRQKKLVAMTSGRPLDEPLDPGSLDELSSAECWRLLSTQPVGRVAVIIGHYPLVFPVNFAVDDQTIVYQTGLGAKLYAIHRSNVTFEVDEIDPAHHSGWSVMVKGVAQELTVKRDRRALCRAELGGATPWAPGGRDHFVRIVADQVTGRRIRAAELAPAFDSRGYL